MGFQNYVFSPSRGLSGGLVLAWRPDFDFEVLFMDHCIIHVLVKSDPAIRPWLCTFAYAPNIFEEKIVF